MDISQIRKDLILKNGSYYFDFTASGLGLKSIEKYMQSVLLTYANTHSQGSRFANHTQFLYDLAREDIKACLGLKEDFALISTGFGCSSAIQRFGEILGLFCSPCVKERYFKNFDKSKAPLVLVGPYEHHSNELCFREGLCECARVPLSKSGDVDFSFLSKVLEQNRGREIIASFSACSNVTGVRTDYKRLSDLVRAYGGLLGLDVASLIAHENIDSSYADAIFIGSHKLVGAVGGCGLLAIKRALIPSKPSFAGGGTVEYVSRSSAYYSQIAELREECGTPGILALIKAGAAFRLRNALGLANIASKERELTAYFLKKLKLIKGAIIYAKEHEDRLPIVSFNIKGFSPYELGKRLSFEKGIETRAGCACAGPYGHDLLGMEDDKVGKSKPGWLRVSLHFTHTREDVDYLLASLEELIA